ncbi:hypothetical protein [Tsuneonella sp. HG222]
MPIYTTKAQVQNYLLTTIDSSFDAQLAAYIAAMSEHCDELAGFPIFREDPETYTYDGDGTCVLLTKPVHTITEITVDGTALDLDDVLQSPYNSPIKKLLKLRSGAFTNDYANVTVTMTHCLSVTLPEKIAWASTVFVALIVNQVNNQGEAVQSEKIGEYQVSFRSQKDRADYELAKQIVSSLRPITF